VDVTLDVDEMWVRAALDALLENAVEHTGPYDLIELAARGEANAVALTVSDSGEGIDPQELERIFERFARADASRSRRAGGAGLGLSIVAAIARAHGGSCLARNGTDGGAVFELRLPLRNAALADEASEPGPPFVADAALGIG
jgi:signal transduction histidine kinase